MPPPLPLSLSPHVCILQSPDVIDVFSNSSLPPIQTVLQSFCPLPQSEPNFLRSQVSSFILICYLPVTTRTTNLTNVPHANFMLRLSDLQDIENACKEDDSQRAERTIDWISARVARRAAKWIDYIEKVGEDSLPDSRTPWWDEIRRCAEGNVVPSRTEGWNHPVAGMTETCSPSNLCC